MLLVIILITGAVTVQPILTARERLRKALLTNYDVYSSPALLDLSQSLRINVGIQANHVQLVSNRSLILNIHNLRD